MASWNSENNKEFTGGMEEQSFVFFVEKVKDAENSNICRKPYTSLGLDIYQITHCNFVFSQTDSVYLW